MGRQKFSEMNLGQGLKKIENHWPEYYYKNMCMHFDVRTNCIVSLNSYKESIHFVFSFLRQSAGVCICKSTVNTFICLANDVFGCRITVGAVYAYRKPQFLISESVTNSNHLVCGISDVVKRTFCKSAFGWYYKPISIAIEISTFYYRFCQTAERQIRERRLILRIIIIEAYVLGVFSP